MLARVYVDGFNLYYGLNRVGRKWLDLHALARALLPDDAIQQVTLFSARVISPPWDPDQHIRQEAYWAALRTRPSVDIVLGRFLNQYAYRPLADSVKLRNVWANDLRRPALGSPPGSVEVRLTEEKGSDVNLAAHLLSDAYEGRCERALVLSNDSDLASALRLAAERTPVRVGVCNCRHVGEQPLRELRRAAGFTRVLTDAALEACQLPDPVVDPRTGRMIHRPPGW